MAIISKPDSIFTIKIFFWWNIGINAVNADGQALKKN